MQNCREQQPNFRCVPGDMLFNICDEYLGFLEGE